MIAVNAGPMTFSAFGLIISCDQPIPGLLPTATEKPASVTIWLKGNPAWLLSAVNESSLEWFVSPEKNADGETLVTLSRLGTNHFRLRYCDGTEFVLNRDGSMIWCNWPETLTTEDMATYLLGPVMGLVLCLRGIICLHASAVAIDGQAIAFLGEAYSGKSTTTASFARRGFPVLCDDIVALSDHGDSFHVKPGYPHLRLWPDSVQSLYGSADALPPLTPNWDKRDFDVLGQGLIFRDEPLTLGAIYFLDRRIEDDAAPFIESMSAREGMMTLITNTYNNRILDKRMRIREFELLSRLVFRIPVCRVRPHVDSVRLSQMCDVILDNFRRLSVI